MTKSKETESGAESPAEGTSGAKKASKKPAKAAKKAKKAAKTATKATKRKARGKSLVIVESPAKARTINKYLGSDFVVRASMGHVRDLPKGKFGIDLEHGFQPEYIPIRGKSKVIGELKKLAKQAPTVYLAPDMDREGEAIAWHLFEVLGVPDERVRRVVFNEITKSAIQEAFREPGRLDPSKVDAQQARRVLDRIMGYKLSPLLWKKIAKGLSAGRVQSVAVRLIVEREKEIRAFESEEYWRVAATLTHGGHTFQAGLRRLGGERIDKNLDEARASELVRRLGGDPLPAPETSEEEGGRKQPERKELRLVGVEALELAELESKPKTRRPTPPFTTSQLQQKASTLLRFSAKKTMMLAQQLYEGVEVPGEGSVGLITYMRTDSTRVSQTAIGAVRELIGRDFGADYLPEKPNAFRTKSKGAQEAHEAIRPTDVMRTPKSLEKALTGDQLKLYRMIWNKFVASQMRPARFQVTTAKFVHPRSDAPSGDPLAEFVAQGEVQEFDGHLRVFQAEKSGAKEREESRLPSGLETGKAFVPDSVDATQHFTQPPPRFTEATLVKELEKKGIGRPSTYAAIISTIQDRGYVTLEQRRFFATELGEIVTDQLVQHFGDLINTEFTAAMEERLDSVENGERRWDDVVDGFYRLFSEDLEKAETGMRDLKKDPELSEFKCDKCGAPMAVLYNKRGKFLGCSRYPDCKNTLPADGVRRVSEVIETDYECPKCGSPMVIRDGKRGRFLACTAFPKCKSTASVDENGKIIEPKKTGIACDKCGSEMVIKGSRRGPFLACSAYPKCRNAKPLPDELREPPKETDVLCEKCGKPMIIKQTRWGKEFLACSGYPDCKNARDLEESSPKEEGAEEARTEG